MIIKKNKSISNNSRIFNSKSIDEYIDEEINSNLLNLLVKRNNEKINNIIKEAKIPSVNF